MHAPGRGVHRLRIGRGRAADRGGRPLVGLDGVRRPISPPDARWRQAQRVRSRRLTRRGQATLATLIGSGLVGVLWLLDPSSPLGGPRAAQAALPPVSAGPPTPAPDPAPAPLPERAPDPVFERLPVSRSALELPRTPSAGGGASGRLMEELLPAPDRPGLRVEYTLDAELMDEVFRVLRRGRVALGNVVVMDPTSGRVLAYAATDPEQFPPTRHYPAASLVKVITAAAALDRAPRTARLPCRYRGSPYRLTPARIDPPEQGSTVSLRRALATSNNQCLAQLAVHALGARPLMEAIDRFGWLDPPAPLHAAGSADPGEEAYDLGLLGSGLAGSRITPLHAAQLAAVLAHGELIAPRWVERVTDLAGERELLLPVTAAPRRVISPKLTAELRQMLVDTTRSGTARRAFRSRGGRPLLGPVQVAGKTGSLSGKGPDGRYEWFVGVAPADAPRVAIASVLVQDELWWRSSSQVAADVLRVVFCDRSACSAEHAERFLHAPAAALAGVGREGAGRLN